MSNPMDYVVLRGTEYIRRSEDHERQKRVIESRKVDYLEAIIPWEELQSRNDGLIDRVTGIVMDNSVIWKWSDRYEMRQTNAESKLVPINTGLERTLPEGYQLVCLLSHVYDIRNNPVDHKYDHKYRHSKTGDRFAPFRERVTYPDTPPFRMMNLSFAAVSLSSLARVMSSEPELDPLRQYEHISEYSSYGTVGFNHRYEDVLSDKNAPIITSGCKRIAALNNELTKSSGKPGLFDRRRIKKIEIESDQDILRISNRINFIFSLLNVVIDNITAE